MKCKMALRHPRVVLLDDDSTILEFISQAVLNSRRRATIVAFTNSYVAWEELLRTPPDLFITDLIHGGISGFQMLARLVEQEVRYPIIVVSGNLPAREAEARAAGRGLQASYWPKPFNQEIFVEEIDRLLE